MKKLKSLFGSRTESQQSRTQTTKPDPKVEQERRKKLITQNTTLCPDAKGCATFLLNLKPIVTDDGKDTCKMEFGTPKGTTQEKIIMLLGATGSGKTTLLNAMINYVFGVEWEDDFRVRLIQEEDRAADQTESQTTVITCYTIHHQDWFRFPYTLTIVDTPGFGDTRGKAMDKVISGDIEEFFKTKGIAGLDHISAIGFVVQSPLSRLTEPQQYIFDSILSLFGNDIRENILPLFTFANNRPPIALQALEKANINVEVYFKFSIDGLFENIAKDNPIDKGFWEMGTTSFKSLFEKVQVITEKSLLLTQQLMSEKETLNTKLEDIITNINNGTSKLVRFDQEQKLLEKCESDVNSHKNYTKIVHERRKELESTNGGWQAKNCMICESTCHYPCGQDYWCSAVNWGGSCKVCGCNYTHHDVMYQHYTYETVQVTITLKDIQKRYQKATGEKMRKEEIVQLLAADVDKMKNEVILRNIEARKCIARIQEIAIKPNTVSTDEYVDEMIKTEKIKQKPEYQERVKQLEKVKKISEFLDELKKAGFDIFADQSVTIAKIREKYDRIA